MRRTTMRFCLAVLALLASIAAGTLMTPSAGACYVCSVEEQQQCNRSCQIRGLYGQCKLCTDSCVCIR